MSSRRFIICIAGIVLVIAVVAVVWGKYFVSQQITLHYNDTTTPLVNPDRGFYIQLPSDEHERIAHMDVDMELILLAFDIAAYRDVALPQDKLEELGRFMDTASSNGKSVIFRAAYGFDESAAENDAASVQQIRAHIAQIAPILNAHKDTVYCVQAGFLGPWGEWHSSRLLTDKSIEEQASVRNDVLSSLLESLDYSIVVNLRRPSFIRDAKQAGIDVGRIGFHNDGLLASDSDLGTYENGARDSDNEWFRANVKSGINGGEMPKVSDWTQPVTAIEQLKSWRVSYLNAFYNEAVLNDWAIKSHKGENALSYISNHLGYRFYVSSLTYPSKHAMGSDSVPIALTITNSGNAPIRTGYTLRWIVTQSGRQQYEGIALEDMSVITNSIDIAFTIPISALGEQPWQLSLAAEGHGNTVAFSTGNNLLSATFEDGRVQMKPMM